MQVQEALHRFLEGWADGKGPLYRRLAASIRTASQRSDFGGSRLPPERLLARQLGVSRTTVTAAYALLAEDGFLDRRQGSGTRVRVVQRQPQPARLHLRPEAMDTLNLLTAYVAGPRGLPLGALESLVEELGLLALESGYSPAGYPPLRTALATYFSSTLGVPTTEDQILVTTGAQQAINLASRLFVQSPDEPVVVEDPTYHGALDALAAVGARLVAVPTDRQGVRLEALAQAFKAEVPRMAYLMPTFHNPVGGVLTDHGRREVVRLVQENGVPLVEDLTVAPLTLDREPPPPLAAYAPDSPILTIGSLSKFFWAGLRVGWVRAAPATIYALTRLKATADLGGSMVSQAIASRLFPCYEEVRAVRCQELSERLDLLERALSERLPSWVWEHPRGGLVLWVRLPFGSARVFTQVALQHGVALVPGTEMSPTQGFDSYLRLPFGLEPEVLAEAVARLGRAWDVYSLQVRDAQDSPAVIV